MTQGEALERIEPIGRNAGNLRRLVEQLNTPVGVIPFVGAGLSMPFGFPGWTNFLLSEAESAGIKDEVQEFIDAGKYEEAAERLMNGLGELDLSAFFQEQDQAAGGFPLQPESYNIDLFYTDHTFNRSAYFLGNLSAGQIK